MKKTVWLWLLFLIGISPVVFADADAEPPQDRFAPGQRLQVKGELILFNGWQPNVRFVTDQNWILGIGTGEDAIIPEVIESYFLNHWEMELILEVTYIDAVDLPYYSTPLPCFEILGVLSARVRKSSTDMWTTVVDSK